MGSRVSRMPATFPARMRSGSRDWRSEAAASRSPSPGHGVEAEEQGQEGKNDGHDVDEIDREEGGEEGIVARRGDPLGQEGHLPKPRLDLVPDLGADPFAEDARAAPERRRSRDGGPNRPGSPLRFFPRRRGRGESGPSDRDSSSTLIRMLNGIRTRQRRNPMTKRAESRLFRSSFRARWKSMPDILQSSCHPVIGIIRGQSTQSRLRCRGLKSLR